MPAFTMEKQLYGAVRKATIAEMPSTSCIPLQGFMYPQLRTISTENNCTIQLNYLKT
jgi:hypothetical protein